MMRCAVKCMTVLGQNGVDGVDAIVILILVMVPEPKKENAQILSLHVEALAVPVI